MDLHARDGVELVHVEREVDGGKAHRFTGRVHIMHPALTVSPPHLDAASVLRDQHVLSERWELLVVEPLLLAGRTPRCSG